MTIKVKVDLLEGCNQVKKNNNKVKLLLWLGVHFLKITIFLTCHSKKFLTSSEGTAVSLKSGYLSAGGEIGRPAIIATKVRIPLST